MELNSLGGNLHSYLCGIQLSHSSFYRIRNLGIGLVLILLTCSLVNQHLGSFYLGCHVSELELGVLETGDGLSELLSLLGVSDGSLKSSLRDTQSLGSDTDTSAVKSMHSNLEACALLTKHSVLGDTAVSEDQLISGRTLDTHLLFLGTEGKSGSTFLNDKGGNLLHLSAPLLNSTGNSDNDINISLFTVGDEALGAVQNPLVSIQYSLGLLSLSVGTCTGLGQTESADLTSACKVGNILLLLLFGTEGHNGIDTKRGMCRYDNACGTADLGKLLDTHSVGQSITALSAVLLGNGNAHEAVLCHLLYSLSGEALCFVNFLCKRLYFVLGEILEQLSRHLMLFG